MPSPMNGPGFAAPVPPVRPDLPLIGASGHRPLENLGDSAKVRFLAEPYCNERSRRRPVRTHLERGAEPRVYSETMFTPYSPRRFGRGAHAPAADKSRFETLRPEEDTALLLSGKNVAAIFLPGRRRRIPTCRSSVLAADPHPPISGRRSNPPGAPGFLLCRSGRNVVSSRAAGRCR